MKVQRKREEQEFQTRKKRSNKSIRQEITRLSPGLTQEGVRINIKKIEQSPDQA